ncbi:MMPL family transporter [Cryptosporangium aurantiacum]|uniref:Putative drug exporter of the RND superfamily n=1 Tax=Cryptosporangium aurantiacum TaxID=134849 RepID=A0A1M7RK33_9ACTN|nr:MMPL family transporter [Cryptosporangium aurantiacum]SHN46506.1 putative drug exporter of the RND superfamily [Cryptosporangium aurantiacum]
MNTLTRRLGAASARRPLRTLLAWVVAAAVLLVLGSTVGGSFADDFAAPGSQSDRTMRLLEERFPEAADGVAIAVFAADDLAQHRAAVDAAVDRIADVPHVARVADPFAAGTISPDGRIGYAEITFDVPSTRVGTPAITAISDALEPATAGGLTAELGGDTAFINSEDATSGAEAAGILAALVVLLVAFGTVVAALIPIVLALIVVGAGLGGIAVLANTMDVSNVAPTIAAMIGLGVGIDYALFITARYREARGVRSREAGSRDEGPRDPRRDNAAALDVAMGTAGTSVLFAGGTVVVAMLALLVTGMGFLISIGLATALVVLAAVLAALTLLPAILSLLGDRIDRGRLPLRRRESSGSRWERVARHVSARPVRYLLAALVFLLALAAPTLSMRLGFPDAGDDSTNIGHRRAYDLLAEGFGPGVNGPLLVVVDLRESGADAGDVPALSQRLADDPGVASVGEPVTSSDGSTVVLRVLTTTSPSDEATSDTLDRLRDIVPANAGIAGLTAMTDDLTHHLGRVLPIFVGGILAASFVLLLLVFRSIVVPLKAVLMNLLSIGGAYGVVVAVFQWGWLKELVGLEQTIPIASPLPVIFFAVLFGLSMDYEVFLLSRIREAYLQSGDPVGSVARGIASTGRVITSAALIMAAVFLAFVASPSPLSRMVGLGLATAVLLDATVVRMIFVPAAMTLLGRANWWLPGWLDRRLPSLGREDATALPAEKPKAAVGQPG